VIYTQKTEKDAALFKMASEKKSCEIKGGAKKWL